MSFMTPQLRKPERPDSESLVVPLEKYEQLYEAFADFAHGKLPWFKVRNALTDAEYTINQSRRS